MGITKYYDAIGTPAQAGSDLTINSSNGSLWDTGFQLFDQTLSVGSDRPVFTDMCMHLGVPHVVWCEFEWDSVNSWDTPRGPYVAKLVSGTWTMVGGELASDAVPFDFKGVTLLGPGDGTIMDRERDNPHGGAIAPWTYFSVGDWFCPTRPQIKSDGVDLYVSYALRKVTILADQPDSSAVNQDYYDGPGANTWRAAPRHVIIKKWSGSSWDLYGDIEPVSNNGKMCWNENVLINGFNVPRMACDLDNPGTIYVSVQECGMVGSCLFWSPDPNNYRPWLARQSVYRFDGSDTVGTELNLMTNSIGVNDGNGGPGGIPFWDYFADGPMGPMDLYVSQGKCYIIRNPWATIDATTTASKFGYAASYSVTNQTYDELQLVDWDTSTILQSRHGSFPFDEGRSPFPLLLQTDDDYAYVTATWVDPISEGDPNPYVYQILKNGLAPFEFLDKTFGSPPGTGAAEEQLSQMIIEPSHNNLWAIGWIRDATPGNFLPIYQFHWNCPNWEDLGQVSNSGTLRLADYFSLPWNGAGACVDTANDTLYVSTLISDTADETADIRVVVYEIPIDRNAGGSCSFNQIIFRNRIALDAAGSSTVGASYVNFKDGNTHDVTVDYTSGVLTVSIDGHVYLTHTINIASFLSLTDAWIGFTGGTGGATEEVDILSFSCTDSGGSFAYTDFTSITGLNLETNASHSGSKVILTPNTTSQSGSLWRTTQIDVTSDFTVSFSFSVPATGGFTPGDGFAFVIQGVGNTMAGGGASDQGFGNVTGGVLAVNFDTYAFHGWNLSDNDLGLYGNYPNAINNPNFAANQLAIVAVPKTGIGWGTPRIVFNNELKIGN